MSHEKLKPVCFAMNDETLLILDEIAAQFLSLHGCVFSRSQIIRAILHGVSERGIEWQRVKTIKEIELEISAK